MIRALTFCICLLVSSAIPGTGFSLALTAAPLKAGSVWKSPAGDRLTLLQGWTLSAGDEGFGGLSALEMFQGALVSVSDQGHFLNLGDPEVWRNLPEKQQTLNPGWSLIPIDAGALKNRGAETDAEALAVTAEGDLLVAFEREHRIQVHTSLASAPRTWEVPVALRRPAPLGFGIEAMTALPDGRIFAVSEKVRRDGGFRAYLITGQRGQNRKLMVYIPQEDWMPSAATTLPDGAVLVIERRVRPELLGFRSRIGILKAEAFKEGARLKPEILFTFGFASVGADNLEGMMALPFSGGQNPHKQNPRKQDSRKQIPDNPGPGKEPLGEAVELWVVSDDNFRPFQQTRLLRFRLDLAGTRTAPEPAPQRFKAGINIKPKVKPAVKNEN